MSDESLSASPRKPTNRFWIIGGSIGVVLLLLYMSCGPETTSSFVNREVASVNDYLQDPQNGFFKLVETAHATVKAKAGSVKSCSVETIDGSDSAGYDGGNIRHIYMVVTVTWDGFIHRDGFTDVAVVVDHQQDKVLDMQITNTDAAVNIYDPALWRALGETLLLLL